MSEMLPLRERVACLDGLRALSIALVLAGHLVGTRGFPRLDPVLFASLSMLGVRVFFVISGFLITTILFDQAERTGTIGLGRFYIRRTLRIFVPYYAFLLTVGVLDRLQVVSIPASDFWSAATYT